MGRMLLVTGRFGLVSVEMWRDSMSIRAPSLRFEVVVI
jgi:hypothetical protein